MKSILCTCALFLLLPWKLTGETTFTPSSTMKHDESFKTNGSTIRSNELNISTTNQTTHRQDEVVFTGHKTTLRTARSTISSPKNKEHTSNHHGKTTNSQTTIKQDEVNITGNETTIRSARATTSSPKNTELSLKTIGKTTDGQTSILQDKVTSKGTGTTKRSARSSPFPSNTTELKSETNGKTTNSQTTIKQDEVNITGNETTIRSARATMFSPKNTELSLKTIGKTTDGQTSIVQDKVTSKGNGTTKRSARSSPFPSNTTELKSETNGTTNNSQTTIRQHEVNITGNETTIRSAEPTIYTTKTINHTLKPNTTNSQASTGLYGHETITNSYKSMTSLLQTKDKYITEESKKVSSSTSPPKTSEQQNVTSVSNAENPTHTVMSSGGKSRSSSHSSFVTAQTRNVSDKATTRRSFNFTSKGSDIYTHEKQTPRTVAKETSKPQTDMSTHLKKTPEVITSPPGIEVKTTGTITTKWASYSQVNESTPLPKFTGTYPLNASTTTGFSTLLSPNVDTEGGTTNTTTLDTKPYEITKNTAGEKKSSPERRTIPITQTDSITTTTSKSPTKESNNESHPGRIVALLIATILCLMLIAFVVIMFKNRQKKKKQKENPDWAGPSPFIEANINPQLPSNNEDGSFHNHEFKRISLHSFLPQRLSKRLSMLSPTEEEIPLEDTVSSTFGKGNVEPLNGNATQDQIQNIEENSPPTEVTLDTNVPEAVNDSPPTENDKNIPTTPKLDEVIPPPPAEIETATPATFEDVDLNLSPEKNTETSSPSDVLHIPSPPLAPS